MASFENETLPTVTRWPSNASNDTEPPFHQRTVDALTVVISSIFAIECIVGLIGNALVIYVILRYAKMKTVTNTYILNLAIADELFMLGVPFTIQNMITLNWPYGTALCKIYLTNDVVTQFVSIFFLAVMSIDRYIAVVHPVQSVNYRNSRNAGIVSGCVWALVIVLMSPAIIAFRSFGPHGDGTYGCGPQWGPVFGETTFNLTEDDWRRIFSFYTFTLGYALPLFIICVAYVLMLSRLRQVGAPGSRGKKTRKVTKMVTVVVGVFFLCWSPYYIMNLCLHYIPPDLSQTTHNIVRTVFYTTQCVGYANSCANPVLYAFLSDNFKKSFQKAFTCATDIQFEPSVSHFRRRSSKGKNDRHQADNTTNSMNLRHCQTQAIMLSDSPTNGPAKARRNGNDPEPVQL
ncbi:somatostatin receptor type 2-like [Ptychodera flava]|uniref:somatostatin receptor type 2-like n=1 Tax=Ptychodera flava TaxID=63121 RepID=UPI00396A78B4